VPSSSVRRGRTSRAGVSDVFTLNGCQNRRDLRSRVTRIDSETCKFTKCVQRSAAPEQETPLFAKGISATLLDKSDFGQLKYAGWRLYPPAVLFQTQWCSSCSVKARSCAVRSADSDALQPPLPLSQKMWNQIYWTMVWPIPWYWVLSDESKR